MVHYQPEDSIEWRSMKVCSDIMLFDIFINSFYEEIEDAYLIS